MLQNCKSEECINHQNFKINSLKSLMGIIINCTGFATSRTNLVKFLERKLTWSETYHNITFFVCYKCVKSNPHLLNGLLTSQNGQ